jgi:hypothetical protein
MADRNPKPITKPEENPLKKDRTYLCPNRSGQTFYIPVRDENNKVVIKTNAVGQPLYAGNKPIYQEEIMRFSPIPTKAGQPAMCSFELKADDKKYDDKYEALEKMRLDGVSWVMNKEDYEEWRNPDAAEYKLENMKLKEELSEKSQTIESMTKQLAELQQQIGKKA